MERRPVRYARLLWVVVVLALAAGIASASAATLGGSTVDELFADDEPALRCASLLTGTAAGSTFTTVDVVTPAGCEGRTLALVVFDSAGTALATGSATFAASTTTVTLNVAVASANVDGVAAKIDGLGVDATLSTVVPAAEFYLRNTFDGGNTTTQPAMPMTPTGQGVPAVSLPNYSTDVHSLPGRRLTDTAGANQTAVFSTFPVTAPTNLSGTATVNIDVSRYAGGAGSATVTATMQVRDASGGLVATLGSGTASTAAGNPGANPPAEALTFTIPTSGTIAPGQRVEVRFTTTTRPIRLLYGTATFDATVGLPTTITTTPNIVSAAPSITSDWGDGYCATVVVSSTVPWNTVWDVTVDLSTAPLDGVPYDVWDANATYDPSSQTLQASGEASNQLVRIGQTATWGFCADRPPPPAGDVDVTVTVTSDWGTGYCADVTVSTTSSTPITWDVAVDLDTAPLDGVPYDVWNANATYDPSSQTLQASGLSHNATVVDGSPTTWGFCANRAADQTSTWTFDGGSLAPASVSGSGWSVGGFSPGPGVDIFGVMNNDAGTLAPDEYAYPDQPQLRWGSGVVSPTPADAVANETFVQFTVTSPSDGYVQLDELSFDIARGGGSTPRGVVLRTSADGFTSDVFVSDVTAQRPTMQRFAVDMSSTGSFGGGDTLELRIYLYAPANGATLEIDNIDLDVGVALP